MKKIFFIVAIFCSISSFAQIKSASLTASGLTCSMCSKAIYKALLKVPFIQNVATDIEASRYDIIFKTGAPVSLDALKKAVEGAGFSVAALQVTAHFDGLAVGNDSHITYDGNTYHFLHIASQTLSGDKTFTVVDKDFMPAKEHSKYAAYTSMKCFKTGHMESCCHKDVATAATRVYHITL